MKQHILTTISSNFGTVKEKKKNEWDTVNSIWEHSTFATNAKKEWKNIVSIVHLYTCGSDSGCSPLQINSYWFIIRVLLDKIENSKTFLPDIFELLINVSTYNCRKSNKCIFLAIWDTNKKISDSIPRM